MAQIVAPQQTSFNAGELSPHWAGRVDMAKYGNGCFRMRNFIPIPQGPARRRPGTRFVNAAKNSSDRSWLAKFVFSEEESYVLEFGNGYIRFYTNNGQLQLGSTPAAWNSGTAYVQGDLVSQGGVNYYAIRSSTNQAPPNATYWHALAGNIYEIWSPYAVGDLTNPVDGTCRLSMDQTGDVIFIACKGYPPKKLSRFDTTRWTITDTSIKNGPFEDVDPDNPITVYASGETGSITLTASSPIFTADMNGTFFLIEQKKTDGYKVWEVGKTIAIGDERRSDSNVYKALNGGTTGSVKPTHREGAKFDGDAGVQWEYLHSGYGICRITSVSGSTATADVQDRIPTQAVGSGNATTKWARYAWRVTDSTGFPSVVKIFRERLCFARGQQVWGSVAADFENFASRDGAETLPDSAFSITIASGETNETVWMTAQESLLVGTRGGEFSLSEVTTNDVFGPGNIKASQESGYGSRQVPPVIIGESTLLVQRSGRRMRDMRYSFNVNGYEANDLMVLSDQIANGQIIQTAFALEPASTMWACCNDGSLIALSYQLEQDVVGWHPHQVGGATGNIGRVESVVSIPSPDGTHDQVWLQVYRVINGMPGRYIEYMERDWRATEQPLEDALFSDSGSTFRGFLPGQTATISGGVTWQSGEQASVSTSFALSPSDVGDYLFIVGADKSEAKVRVDDVGGSVTFITPIPPSLQNVLSSNVSWARRSISGLGYLEGEEVTITVNGAAHPRRTVVGGQITLQAPASVVQVGLPADAELITMRLEGGYPNGTAQGRTKRIHNVVYRLHESLGGSAGPEGGEDEFLMRSPPDAMDQPPPIFTGDYIQPYNDGYNTDARIRVFCDQPLPFTLVAIYPQLKVDGETR